MRIMWCFCDFHQLQLDSPSSLFSFSFFFIVFFLLFSPPIYRFSAKASQFSAILCSPRTHGAGASPPRRTKGVMKMGRWPGKNLGGNLGGNFRVS